MTNSMCSSKASPHFSGLYDSGLRLLLVGASLFFLATFIPSVASAKQTRLFAGSFGAASNPAPFPANPYPLSESSFVAVDEASHDVYVTDRPYRRVEKFDSAGNFILMFGKEVNKTKVEAAAPEAEQNLCTAASGDECQAGKRGTTPGTFDQPGFLALDNSSGTSKGDLYVANLLQPVTEQQAVTVNATGGTFTLSFEGQTTAPIAFNAPTQPFFGAGSVQAALEALPDIGSINVEVSGAPGSYTVRFASQLFGRDVPQMIASSAGLSGGAATATVATTVQGSSTTRAEVEKFDPSGHPVTAWAESGQLNGSSVTSPPAPVAGPFNAGPFGGIGGIAVDSSGNLWVDAANQMFEFRQDSSFVTGWKPAPAGHGIAIDSENNLYLEGAVVNKFDSAGHEIGAVAPSRAEFEAKTNPAPGGLTVDTSTNDLYIDKSERPFGGTELGVIQRYDSSCHPIRDEFSPQPGCPAVEAFGTGLISSFPGGLAVDASTEALYVAQGTKIVSFASLTVPDTATTKPTNPTHTSATLDGTVNPSGIELNPGTEGCRFEWGETTSYGTTVPCDKTAVQIGAGNTPVEVHADISGLEAGKTYHYRLVASNHNDSNEFINEPSFGQDIAFGPPLIESASAIDVSATSATLQAQVNPNDLNTHVRIEYVPQQQFEMLGFSEPLSTEETDIGSAGAVQTVTSTLPGLTPATTYHYRLVAENILAEGAEAVLGQDLAFTTQATGALTLPDSRGWELVSPPNKLGARLQPIGGGVVQASSVGDAITYVANAPTESLPPGNSNSSTQVISARGGGAWTSHDISIPHETAVGVVFGHGSEVRFFSADLSRAFIQPYGAFTPSISAEASEQTAFLRTDYRGPDPISFCSVACYRPLVTGAEGFANVPLGTEFGEEDPCEGECGPRFIGASPDASHVALTSTASLAEGAPAGGLYEWSDGVLQLISILPGAGGPAPASSGPSLGEHVFFQNARNAVSSDGSRVVWSEGSGKHHLYLRDTAREETLQLDAVKGGSGKGTAAPQFQTASVDDSRIFFTDEQQLTPGSAATKEKRDLYECEVVEGESGELECKLTDLSPESSGESGDVLGVPGASDDGSWVYFIANGVLTGAEENEQHETAEPGSCENVFDKSAATCNLYLRHGGTTTLIALLSGKDSPDWASTPGGGTNLAGLTARVSPDGQRLAFMSQRPLTGYDNRDAASGVADQEVFLYDASPGTGQAALVCASCSPSGARPHGAEYDELTFGHGGLAFGRVDGFTGQTVAANIPGWTGHAEPGGNHQSRYLSDSGRLFFNSSDALVPRDSNGTGDVYQYEPPGVGDCTTESPSYAKSSGGCISLISSGTSKDESAFLDASESGNDVFFLTHSQLTPRDIDTALDVYDASVGGGEAEPIPPVLCEGDGCQQPATPPNDPTPGSLTFHGAGNLNEAKAKKKHAKKHKRKAQKKQKRANSRKHGGAK